MKKQPMRTCVMCRQKKEKRDLLRIVRTPEGVVQFDPTGKANGRGAYVCTADECLSSVKNVKKVSQALETDSSAEHLSEVFEEIKRYVNERDKGER